MKPIRADFIVARGPRPVLWWGVLAITVLACIAGAFAWREAGRVEQLRRELQAARASAEAPRRQAPPAPPPPYAESAAVLLAEHNREWHATLLALERTAMQGVTPVAIEIQPRERTARVEVEFSGYATLLKYVDQLNAGLPEPEWSLISAQATGPGPQGGANSSTATLRRSWPERR